MVILFLLLLV